MENKKRLGGSSSSSSTSDIFGSKDSSPLASSSSNDLFASVFGPSSTGLGKESTNSGILRSLIKQDVPDQYGGNAKYGTPEYMMQRNKGESGSVSIKDKSSIYQHERVEPCYLSSSIFYGGQEVYSPSSQASQHVFKKVGGDNDDPNGSSVSGASRGNWWEGSLYY